MSIFFQVHVLQNTVISSECAQCAQCAHCAHCAQCAQCAQNGRGENKINRKNYVTYVNDSKKSKNVSVTLMVYNGQSLCNCFDRLFTSFVTVFFGTSTFFGSLFWRFNMIRSIPNEWSPVHPGSTNTFGFVGLQDDCCLCPLGPKFADTVCDLSIRGHHVLFPKHTHHVLTRLFMDVNMCTTIHRSHAPAHIHFDVFCICLRYVFHVKKFAGAITTNNCKP